MADNAIMPAPKIGAATMEKVLIQGDLKGLTPSERVHYYNSVCQSLGLNPLTRPFDYLTLNGKVMLYAKRECTEQLRQIHSVDVSIKAREVTEGCFAVTATAKLPTGRTDESIGAVSLEGLKGEARANALMKAETKAKRRVTLSICGLAFLDESEIDGVRPAVPESLGERPWSTFKGMLECFAQMKATVGNDAYYRILAEHGVAHSNEFRDAAKALACYRALEDEVNFPQAQPGTSAV